jgi:glycosyltransferase involved in cell wall biosynthesis
VTPGGGRILVTTDAVGGVWQYTADLVAALGDLGFEAIVALMGPPPAGTKPRLSAAPIVDTGLPLDWLCESPDEMRLAATRMAELAGDYGVDVAHLNTPALSGADYSMPKVAVAHSCLATWWHAVEGTELPENFRWRAALHREGLAQADLVAAPSRAFARATQQAHGLAAMPEAIVNGRAPLLVRDAPMEDAVFTAGRLWDRGKNLACLDRMAARLDVPVRAAGPTRGPSGDAVTLADLEVLGTLDEVALAERLSVKPIFASAALYEPFGLAVLEAAGAGCALVLADIPTFRELWDGVALFCPPHDDAGFAALVRGLLADRPRRVALGEAARRRARRYDPAAMAAGMAALYRSVAPALSLRLSLGRMAAS